MVREIIHDTILLARKSEPATAQDLSIAQDLLDTLMAHKESCVGMAANMIGVRKRIIAFLDERGRHLPNSIKAKVIPRAFSHRAYQCRLASRHKMRIPRREIPHPCNQCL